MSDLPITIRTVDDFRKAHERACRILDQLGIWLIVLWFVLSVLGACVGGSVWERDVEPYWTKSGSGPMADDELAFTADGPAKLVFVCVSIPAFVGIHYLIRKCLAKRLRDAESQVLASIEEKDHDEVERELHRVRISGPFAADLKV